MSLSPRLTAAVVLSVVMASADSADGTTFYVAPTGLDSNAGTLAHPWRTVQKAANTLRPGDSVLVRTGTYREAVNVNVSGLGQTGGGITFENYPGEKPVLDGTGLSVPANADTALFYLDNVSFITIQGFELRNYSTNQIAPTPAGIFITGTSSGIEIRGCDIHDIVNSAGDPANAGNAFAIAVYGISATPCAGILIDRNNIHHCRTGSSETVSLNGNVTNFQVFDNLIHDNDNIGIDFIGFEGTCPEPALDQARDGTCTGNIIWNISSQGNQAYPSGDFSADGLYVDGGTGITIGGNISFDNDIGVELASEHPGRVTSKIQFHNNIVYSCRQGGLLMGGYAPSGTGGTEGCTITNNTFWHNDTLQFGNGEVQLRSRTSDCVIRQNIFNTGAENLLVTVPVSAANNVSNTFDSNLYFSDAGTAATAQWVWNNHTLTGFAAWKSTSHQDAHSLFANPQFVSTGTPPNLDLKSSSPAIPLGAGSNVPVK